MTGRRAAVTLVVVLRTVSASPSIDGVARTSGRTPSAEPAPNTDCIVGTLLRTPAGEAPWLCSARHGRTETLLWHPDTPGLEASWSSPVSPYCWSRSSRSLWHSRTAHHYRTF